MNFYHQWKRNRALRKQLGDRTCLNLGTGEPPWPGYVTCGLDRKAEVQHDATKPFPKPMQGRFVFIWSERMLEHISCEAMPAVFAELKKIMHPTGRARFCLPICFYGDSKVNMVRAGNAARCADYGHVTWFTHEGLGPVTDEVFGLPAPPNQHYSWRDLLDPLGLNYHPIRHYGTDGALFQDGSVMGEDPGHPFVDRPEIRLLRPDSLVFDIVWKNP